MLEKIKELEELLMLHPDDEYLYAEWERAWMWYMSGAN